jgi:hypothetical protein
VFSCKPDLGDRSALVDVGPRVLAVRGEPPEVKPGQPATFDALVVGPDGTLAGAALEWAFCATPKALGNDDVVSPDCLAGGVVGVPAVAPVVQATVPGDACTLFGPDPPPGGFAPQPADETGGYYQPVRAIASGAPISFGEERVLCNLAAAPIDAARDYAMRYVPNKNPKLLPLAATQDLSHVAPGSRVVLTASWAAADAEAYVSFDVASQVVVDRREAMRVSWFASGGSLDSDRTGRAEGDTATSTDDGFTAPDAAGTVHLSLVLRDSRGGTDLAGYDPVVVAP